MSSSSIASRALLVYALCLPVAVLLGYFLAEPGDLSTLLLVFLVVGVLSIPLLMRWYHPLLLLTWNAAIAPLFFPGHPFLWMILAFLGLGFAILNRFTSAEVRFTSVPGMTKSLLFLAAVVLATAWARGGIGARLFGSSQYGGRSYFYVLAALVGYFALTSRRIPKEHAGLMVSLFFLSGLTAIVPNLAYTAGRGFDFVFYLFPSLYAQDQASMSNALNATFIRINGLSLVAVALYCWLFAKYGLKGTFDLSKPWRLLVLLAAFACSLYSGFRGSPILLGLTIVSLFFLEGLCHTRIVLATSAAVVVGCVLILPNTEKLPLAAQRAISFLPVRIDPLIRLDAINSSEWRLRMWSAVLPQIPKYLLKGKGYTIDSTDLQFAFIRGGLEHDYSGAMTAEDYHNGLLTLLIPFGLWGFGAFTAFLVICWRYMYRHVRFGDPDLRQINTLILAFFAARIVFYFVIFGSLVTDLSAFTGLAALSVSLNGAALPEPAVETETEEAAHEEAFAALQGRSEAH